MTDNSGFQVGEHAPQYYDSMVHRFMAPFVEALVDAAVKEGDAVLDVACGTGFAARAAALVTGPTGRVVGSDLNPAMVAMAETVPIEEGCDIAWQQASALDLPFADAEFDSVVCQQGIQFFPDNSAGLREMARVVKLGGCVAATVWAPREQSPYLDAIFGMLTDHCEGDPIANAKTYANGGVDQIREWFVSANLKSVTIELVEAEVWLPPIMEYVPDHLKALPPPSLGKFFDLSYEVQNELIRSVDGQLDKYRIGHGFSVPFSSYMATALI